MSCLKNILMTLSQIWIVFLIILLLLGIVNQCIVLKVHLLTLDIWNCILFFLFCLRFGSLFGSRGLVWSIRGLILLFLGHCMAIKRYYLQFNMQARPSILSTIPGLNLLYYLVFFRLFSTQFRNGQLMMPLFWSQVIIKLFFSLSFIFVDKIYNWHTQALRCSGTQYHPIIPRGCSVYVQRLNQNMDFLI